MRAAISPNRAPVLPTITPALKYDADAIPAAVENLEPAPVAKRTLTVLTKRATASKKGRIAVEVGCASACAACTGKVQIASAVKKSLIKKVSVRSGHKKVIRFTLPREATKNLAKGKAVKVRVILRGTGATTAPKAVVIIVRR